MSGEVRRNNLIGSVGRKTHGGRFDAKSSQAGGEKKGSARLKAALTQANWNASKTYGVWNEASSHAEAKEIYANMGSQVGRPQESVLAEKRRATTREGQRYMSKVVGVQRDGVLHGDYGPQEQDAAARAAEQEAPHRAEEGALEVPRPGVQAPRSRSG